MEFHHRYRFRVRFYECDGMRVVHHSNYLRYFESARVEMMRGIDLSYGKVEEAGLGVVVTDYAVRCRASARFDEELEVRTRMLERTRVRGRLAYRVERAVDGILIAEGETGHATVDATGRPTRMPEEMLEWARRLNVPIGGKRMSG